MEEMKNRYKIFVWNPEWKGPLGRFSCRRGGRGNTKLDVKGTE